MYIHLAVFEELENDDIAIIMKKSKKQIANLSYRARNAIREAIRKEGILS
jgi:DNA-directed RNA polymerase specialized sigma24 family protein